MDIYRRIYRLANKNIPASQIAITLGLPLKNVKDILKKMNGTHPASTQKSTDIDSSKKDKSYLDIYITQSSRTTVVDLSGFATDKNRVKLKVELNRVDRGEPKIVAFLLKNLKSLDSICYQQLQDFTQDYRTRGRYVAFLDPSPEMEEFIENYKVEDEIPVFGTVSALEAKALSTTQK